MLPIPISLLYVPSIKVEKYLPNLSSLDTSGFIFDLEDSVANSHKKQARDLLIKLLPEIKKLKGIYLRINSLESEFFQDDLNFIEYFQPDILTIPKIQNAEEVRFIDNFVSGYNKKHKQKLGFRIIIESLAAYKKRDEIFSASDNIFTVSLGYEDLCSELLMERPKLKKCSPLNTIIQETIISAKMRNIPVLDAVYKAFQEKDLEALEQEALYSRSIGMIGKIAIHPEQLPIINKVFRNNPLLNKSKLLLEKFSQIKDGSSVVLNEQGEMEDMPALKLAEKLIGLN